MDDFERNLKAGLSAEVGGWQPTSSQVWRTAPAPPRRRLHVAVALASVLVLAAGGVGIAVGVSGGHKPAPSTLAADPAPTATSSPLTTSSLPDACDTAPGFIGCDTPSAVPTAPGCVTTTSQAGSRTYQLCLDTSLPTVGPVAVSPSTVESAIPTVTSAPTVKPSVKPTERVFKLPPQCTASDLHLSVTTDKTSYVQGDTMHFQISSEATSTCDAPGVVIAVERANSTGAYLWSTCGYTPPNATNTCTASLPIYEENPGDHKDVSYTWDFTTAQPTDGEPATYLGNSDLKVVYRLGNVEASTPVHLDFAPTCSASQLAQKLVTDATTYHQGQTAMITETSTNTSSASCDLADGPLTTPAVDASGTQVWSGCYSTGLPKGQQACAYSTVAELPFVLIPGGSSHRDQSWALMRDGTDTSDPSPVADGTYTLSDAATVGTLSASLTVTG